MAYADDLLNALLSEVQVSDDTLSAARARRTEVLDAVGGFGGVLRTYRSGSLAYGTAIQPPPNKPDDKGVDGDGGLVLDRTVWSSLGPDADTAEGPAGVVEQVQDHIRPALRDAHPDLTVGKTPKRAIHVKFNEPLDSGEDPPVELIVALTRKSGGLWIPDLTTDGWDAADPVTHHRLIVDDPKKSLRVRRARVMRLVKHWNKKHTKPAFTSFHLQALALEAVTQDDIGCQLRTTIEGFFDRAAASMDEKMTADPAGVSGEFHLENDVSVTTAVARLRAAADAVKAVNADPDDREQVRAELSTVFHPDTVEAAEDRREKEAASRGNSSATVLADGTIATSARVAVRAARREPAAWAMRR